jgi:uncharacterized protein (DUF58 family)
MRSKRQRKRFSLSEAWVWLAILLIGAGYLFHAPGMLAVAGILLPSLLIAWAWNRVALRNVVYQRRFQYRRAFPGETVDCELRLENRKLTPLAWLRLNDHWPIAVAPEDGIVLRSESRPEDGELSLLFVLRGNARLRRKLTLNFRERGVYRVGPAMLYSGDPLGLFGTEEASPGEERLTVMPQVFPLRDLGFRTSDPFGMRSTRQQLFKDINQPIGVRDYRPTDSFRHIHWPATARMGHLQSRIYQPVAGQDLILCLNAATMEMHWMGVDPELLEDLIRMAASLAAEAFEQGYRVGLVSNGSIARGGRPFRIPPGRSPQHLPQMLEALAGLVPLVAMPFERFLLNEAPHIEYGSTLVVLTAVTPPALVESLVQLRRRTRRTALISLAEAKPPFVPGVQTIHLPMMARKAKQ